MDVPCAPDWVERAVGLEYHFAGRKLGTVWFQAQVDAVPFEKRPSHPPESAAVARLSRCGLAQLFSHPVAARFPRVALLGSAFRYVPRHYRRHVADTTGTFDDYLKGFTPKTRQTVKRKVRRYCTFAGSDAPWRAFSTPDQLREFHSLARTVSAATYQERLFGAGLPEWPEFARLIQKAGAARGYLLFKGATPVAYLFTPVCEGRAVYMSLGFAPDCAEWSPGAVLQYFALSSMFTDPDVRLLDFAEGEGQHKETFATRSTDCADVYYFRLGLRPAVAVAAHLLLSTADRAAIRVLDWLRIKAALRRAIRFGRTPRTVAVP